MGSCKNHPDIRARKDGLCEDCLAAAEAKVGKASGAPPAAEPAAPPRGRRPRRAKVPGEAGVGLRIDFSSHKEILDRIGQMAIDQFRSIEGQILFLLDQATQSDD